MKDRSFAAKAAKGKGGNANSCPVCGESFTAVKLSKTDKHETTGAYRFSDKIVKMCKCNEKEIFG